MLGRPNQVPSRRVTIHYRRLVRDQGWDGAGTLSDSIRAALRRSVGGSPPLTDDWQARVTSSPDDTELRRFINNCSLDEPNCAYGNLCTFVKDELQAVIGTGSAGPSVAIDDLGAPTGDFLQGMAYWLAIGDHCYVIQHSKVRTRALEEYLTWLLRDKTGVTSGGVTLRSEIDVGDSEPDLGDVSSVEIGGLAPETVRDPSAAHVDPPQSRVVEHQRSLGEHVARFTRARQVLDVMLGAVATQEILDRMPSQAALQLNVHISYLSRSREIDRTAINEFGTAFRNLDDGEVRIRAKDGTIRREEARLHLMVPINRVRANSSLLDLADVRRKLLHTHARFVREGRVPAD